MSGELDQLRATLDGLRAGVLKKLAGSARAARRSTVESGTNLAGLVQHLTFVESLWFEEIVAGGRATEATGRCRSIPRSRCEPCAPSTALLVTASNEIIAALGDADAPVTRDGKTHDLRWAMLAVIQETARHAGHADIIREQIDGQTGR